MDILALASGTLDPASPAIGDSQLMNVAQKVTVTYCSYRGQFIRGHPCVIWCSYGKRVIVYESLFHRKSASRDKMVGSLISLAWH